MNDTCRRSNRGFIAAVVVLAAAGTVLSILATVYTRPEVLRFDENYYYPLAKGITQGSYNDGYIVRPPLYPLFLAGLFGLVGTGFTAVLILESILRGLLIAGVAVMGRRWISPLAGCIGGLLVAVYPLLIWTYTRFVSEVLYIPVFVAAFYFIDKAVRTRDRRSCLAAGVLSGLAALVRSTSLPLTVVIAVWMAGRKTPEGRFSRKNVTAAIMLVAAMLAVVSPWTIRNAVVHKAFIPVDTAAAFNLWLITSGKEIQEATPEWIAWGSQAERQREGYRRWTEYLRQDPLFHIRRLGTTLPRLLNPLREPAVKGLSTITRGNQSRQVGWLKTCLMVLVPVVFWLLLAGGSIGVAMSGAGTRGSRRSLIFIVLAYFLLLHGMTLARPRFLLPILTVLSVYSGRIIELGLTRWGWTRRSPP
jgi:4-amino-4-deoxy-L-arabinose transferase-like glycosyltransferase